MIQPLGTLLIKEPQNQLFENKYYKRGNKAAKEGRKRDVNPYKLEKEIWELLRKRTYWIMGFEDFYFSRARQKIDAKKAKEEKKRQKHKDRKQKAKDKHRKERSKHRHEKHRHEHKH